MSFGQVAMVKQFQQAMANERLSLETFTEFNFQLWLDFLKFVYKESLCYHVSHKVAGSEPGDVKKGKVQTRVLMAH